MSEFFLFLEFANIYEEGLKIFFPSFLVNIYNILWCIFWPYFFYTVPRYAYHLAGKELPFYQKIIFIIFSLMIIPYISSYFFAYGSLWYKITKSIMELLLIYAMAVLFTVLIIYRRSVKKKEIKIYLRTFLFFSVFISLWHF
ncbi:MAG: hypothetical protein ACP5QT_06245 [Brevinematia bacterium]